MTKPENNKCTRPTPEQVKLARQCAGLTQEQAAAVVHRIGRSRWSEWETGKRQMQDDAWELFLLKTGQAMLMPFISPKEKSGQ